MKLFQIPYFVAFIICLLFGRIAGGYIAHTELRAAHASETKSAQSEQLPAYTDQQNFLVVKVDDLEKDKPDLQVVWWLLHKDRVPLNLLPVFPSLGNPIQDEIVRQSFSLEKTFRLTRLSPTFEASLYEEGIQWHAYIILDDISLAAITGNAFPEATGVNRNKSAGEAGSLDNQWLLRLMTHQWKDICKQALQVDWQDKIQGETIDDLLQSHMILGPDENAFFASWDRILADNPGLRCIFPTSDSTDLD